MIKKPLIQNNRLFQTIFQTETLMDINRAISIISPMAIFKGGDELKNGLRSIHNKV